MQGFNNQADCGASKRDLVFVYGSLKRGMRSHNLLANATFLGATTLNGLDLYDLGPFPMAVESSGTPPPLQGEVYSLTRVQLAQLDQFEGVPRLYERKQRLLSDGRQVWVYVGRPRQVRHVSAIPSGLWRGPRGRDGIVLALLALGMLSSSRVWATDLQHACLEWRRAHGHAQVVLTNQIGSEQLLTKTHRFAEAQPDASVSLYNRNDIARLCRLY